MKHSNKTCEMLRRAHWLGICVQTCRKSVFWKFGFEEILLFLKILFLKISWQLWLPNDSKFSYGHNSSRSMIYTVLFRHLRMIPHQEFSRDFNIFATANMRQMSFSSSGTNHDIMFLILIPYYSCREHCQPWSSKRFQKPGFYESISAWKLWTRLALQQLSPASLDSVMPLEAAENLSAGITAFCARSMPRNFHLHLLISLCRAEHVT